MGVVFYEGEQVRRLKLMVGSEGVFLFVKDRWCGKIFGKNYWANTGDCAFIEKANQL